MTKPKEISDRITDLAHHAMDMQDTLNASDVVQRNAISEDDLLELYVGANYEQRYKMFTEVLGSQGVDGMKALRNIYNKAHQRFATESGGAV